MGNRAVSTILLLALAITSCYSQDVIIKYNKLFVEQQEFFIKAICYSPSPWGYVNGAQTGLCSDRRLYPIGGEGKAPSIQDGCYLRDFFDGSTDAGRVPAGPDQWFQGIWARDFPVLQELGVNTIRLYHTNPITTLAVQNNPALYPVEGIGSNHIPFLDMAQQYNLKVIFPLFDDKTAILTLPKEQMETYLKYGIDEVGNHPAVLMFAFGNEMGVGTDPALRATVNEYLDFIRNYTMAKWNRKLPVTLGEVDLPNAYNLLAADLHVDLLMTNAGYRGPGFSDLWSGWDNGIFWGWKKLSCMSGKPLLIGEIGQHSTDNWFNDPTWFPAVWDDLIAHIDEGAIGGALFEWSDEPWKADNQQKMGVVSYTVTAAAEGNSDQVNVFAPDTLAKKIGQGAYDFTIAAQAFAKDPFQALGRQAYTLDNVPDLCIGVTWPTDNPVPATSVPPTIPLPDTSGTDGGSQNVPPPYLAFTFDQLTEGSTVVQDGVSGHGFEGHMGGNITVVPGKYGKAIHMQRIVDGQPAGDQYVDLGNALNLTSGFSIAVWIRVMDPYLDDHMKIVSSKGLQWNAANGFELEYYPAKSTLSFIGAGDQVAQAFKTLDKNWHHIVAVVNGPNVNLYVDGRDITQTGVIYPLLPATNTLLLGSNTVEPLSGGTFSGDIDEFIIFDTPLNALQVRELVVGGSIIPSTTDKNPGPSGSPSGTENAGHPTEDPLHSQNDLFSGANSLVMVWSVMAGLLILVKMMM